ncbi:MAG: hypothetical protein J6B77_08350 [Clostridia bacterium]|nr:hypothetical protein [Clostridia bacterium]
MYAIVYTSNTGHTEAYAKLIGEKLGLPVYSLKDALKDLDKGTEVLYFGWIFANFIKGYPKAAKYFTVKAVCAVGLCDTGTLLEEVRQANKLSEALPLFTLQGGMDKTRLRGINRFMIDMLIKNMSKQTDQSEDDARKLELLQNDRDYVSEENAVNFFMWYRGIADEIE